MPVTRAEAEASLKSINETEAHGHRLRRYRGAAPFFVIWGLVWMFGYAGTDFAPDGRAMIWGASVLVGSVLSIVAGRSVGGSATRSVWRSLAISGLFAAFGGAMIVLLHGTEQRLVDAVIPMLFAAAYSMAGLFLGSRFLICGLVLGFGTLLAYSSATEHFGLVMAAVGGGVLLLTGLWLRSA